MPKVEKQQWIQQQVLAVLDKKGLSQSEFARMVDVSAANVSHIVTGRWDRTMSDEIWNRVAAPFGAMDELRLLETGGYLTVRDACQRAATQRTLICVLGQPGYGKTTALRRHFLTTPHVYLVAFKYSMSRREFFADVARSMGLEVNRRTTLNGLIQQCADKLNSATGSVLLVDEVSTVQVEKLHYLRELRERTYTNAGIVLAGVPYFKAKLERWTKADREGVPEFVSRISDYPKLPAPTPAEVKAICQHNGLKDAATIRELAGAPEYRRLANAVRNLQQGAQLAAA